MILGARPDGALRITFVECGYQRFVKDFLLSKGASYRLEQVKSWRAEWQEFSTPGTTENEKEIVCAFNADWTVYVDNSANCTAKNVYYAMPHRLHTRGVSFLTMLPRATVKFKAFSMDYVDGTRSAEGVLLRSVGVYQEDSSWVFQGHGNPLPFEDVSRYRARRKTDRIDHALLCQYAAALGLELEIESELHSVGVITWVPGGHEPVSKTESARSFVSQFVPGKFRVITKRNLSDEVQQ